MNNKYVELSLSFLTLILVVIAVIIFIKTGGSIIFYSISIMTIVVGLINIWKISKSEQERINKNTKSIKHIINKSMIKSKTKIKKRKIKTVFKSKKTPVKR